MEILTKNMAGLIVQEEQIRFDHSFDIWQESIQAHQPELCHHTGRAMWDGEVWWGEFVDSNGDLHYGN